MNTRDKFVQRAVRAEEKRLGIPPGWWGTYRDFRGPNGARVRCSSDAWIWTVSQYEKRVSRHDSRAYAIRVAGRLGERRG